MERSIRILQAILTKIPLDAIIRENQAEMANLVMAIGRQFGILQTALKFDALHVLDAILSSESAVEMHDLRSSSNAIWASYVRTGIIDILQNRVVFEEKRHALALANFMMFVRSERWLLDKNNLDGDVNNLSEDKCLLLVLECARIEVAVLLNEIARLKFEESGNFSHKVVYTRQHSLAILFSLIEKIIKLISNEIESEGSPINEHTITKAISGIDETIHLVLDFLTDAKEHGQHNGDDLLAAVRLLGSYLAETPFACRDKVNGLLGYILSVKGNDELRPFYSICFMLPMLSQTTSDKNGYEDLISCGGHKNIVKFIASMTLSAGIGTEDDGGGTIISACEIIRNLFLNKDKTQNPLEIPDLAQLLQALVFWTENDDRPATILNASCVCVLALGCTSMDKLAGATVFDHNYLRKLFRLILLGLDMSRQISDSSHDEELIELSQIIITGYPCLRDRFPSFLMASERR